MRQMSIQEKLSHLQVGDRVYLEGNLGQLQRQATLPDSRRPKKNLGKKFSATCFTAVSAREIGVIRYLVCIERTA